MFTEVLPCATQRARCLTGIIFFNPCFRPQYFNQLHFINYGALKFTAHFGYLTYFIHLEIFLFCTLL